MKRLLLIVICLAIAASAAACIELEDIRPSYSSDEFEPESSVTVFSEPSSEVSEEPSSEEPTSEPSEPSSEEASELSVEESKPPVVEAYSYNGFTVYGFSFDEISSLIDTLAETISGTSANIGVYYEETETGYYISYNDDKFSTGSVIKAPYSMYLMSEFADIDLTQEFTLRESQKMDGSGILKDAAAGKSYSIEKLIEYAIVYSDNTAYKMLYDNFDFDGFSLYTYSMGIDANCSSSRYLGYLGNLSAKECGELFGDIYERSKTEEPAQRLLGYLTKASYDYLLVSGIPDHPVAHKYGYMNGTFKGLNDVGIVLDTSPYIISVMTDFNPAGGNGRKTFKSIATSVNDFHNMISN